jgi:uncharacterized protein YkwD
MTSIRKAGLRRRAATVGALVALGVAAVASLAVAAGVQTPAPNPARGATKCNDASVPAADSTTRELRNSVRCLVNQERAVHGLGKLDRNEALKTASQWHAKTMVETGCLAHRCPGEDDLDTRLDRAGYFDGAASWRYAENTGCGASAEAMVANWMDTVYHRVNILDPDFHDIGVGVSHERVNNRCGKGYATFAVVFGDRKLSAD